jgi:hypothetical protein
MLNFSPFAEFLTFPNTSLNSWQYTVLTIGLSKQLILKAHMVTVSFPEKRSHSDYAEFLTFRHFTITITNNYAGYSQLDSVQEVLG